MVKEDFKVGQKVFLKIEGGSNAARHIDKSNPEAWIKEKFVVSMGKKYITVASDLEGRYGEVKFIIQDNFRQYYACGGEDYELYLSKEEILEDMESERLHDLIKRAFSGFSDKNYKKWSLEQLKTAVETLGIKS